MPLPRNARAKNQNTRKRNAENHGAERRAQELNTICKKNHIGSLSLNSCKYATAEGKVTFVEQDQVQGNMRAGVMILRVQTLAPSTDVVYDVVGVANAKKEREEKKRKEDAEKALAEIKRLQETGTTDALPEGGEKHKEMINKLTDSTEENADAVHTENTTMADTTADTITDTNANNETVQDNTVEESDDAEKEDGLPKKNKKKTAKDKREQALNKLQEQLAQKANEPKRNKFYRNFMKDLRSKFKLSEVPDTKYFEVKMESTPMIIEDAKVYNLEMPENTPYSYLLVVGDLQMKSAVLRQIDPAYQSDIIMRDQMDFLERIRAKDKSLTTEHSEDMLDNELDDVDQLGLSEEDDPDTDKNDNNNSVPELIQA
jgi:hypothetical protein